ncbi:MAG: acylneuraminate cytidylyltransferase family protein [Actinomycetes bacterium]
MTIVQSSSILAIIPARGGSKGLPRKNLLPVAGKPLLAWTIEAVQDADAPIRCVVSTDDDEIAALARDLGTEVVRRPAELASDESPTELSLLHVLDILQGVERAKDVMLLQATSPVRLQGTVDRALRTYFESGVDSLVGVVKNSPFLWRGPTDRPVPLYDPAHRSRRQDFSVSDLVYRETGSLYVTSVEALLGSANRISGRTALFVMDDVEGTDIDSQSDVAEAQRLLGGDFSATGT